MNFLKKKLKPLTSGLNSASRGNGNSKHNKDKDLEDDLYDEYVVEAPPHPSELLALGVDPGEIDVNDPEKLRDLYQKAKAEGKDKKANSTLLARQRQKEEIEEKKKTREEWKFFDSITARVEQVVKESQKNLNQWRESSAVNKLAEPEYELRLTADQVFKSSSAVKLEKGADSWIDFADEAESKAGKSKAAAEQETENTQEELDEFGCPKGGDKEEVPANFVAEKLLEDFGIDLRSEEERKAQAKLAREQGLERQKELQQKQKQAQEEASAKTRKQSVEKINIDLKVAARPRPRPKSQQQQPVEEDPFDTSFVSVKEPEVVELQASIAAKPQEQTELLQEPEPEKEEPAQVKSLDPFDTSYVNF